MMFSPPSQITPDKIFENHLNNSQKENVVILVTTGDIMLGREVNASEVSRNNFTFLFDKTRDMLTNADITFINLEGTLINNCPIQHNGMTFCGNLNNVQGLKEAGIDIANLANNHSSNYNEDGLKQTEQALASVNIFFTGISGPVYKEVKNTRFAFLGYNDISPKPSYISNIDEEKMKAEISIAKKNADIVVVQFHWGVEYTTAPTERQIHFGHLAIDFGADLVIGNHPHWIGPVENYKDKIIVYSQGNFIFDQFWSQKTKEGIVDKFTFLDKKLVGFELLPVFIDSPGSPRFLKKEEKDKILDQIKEESYKLQQRIKAQKNDFFNPY